MARLLKADEAAKRLGVSRQTLYTRGSRAQRVEFRGSRRRLDRRRVRAAVIAGLAALTGPRHGAATARIEA